MILVCLGGIWIYSGTNISKAQTVVSEQKKISKDFNKIEGGEIAQEIHKQFDKLLMNRMVGYSFCFLKDGKPIAKGGIGWSRAPWEKESPSVPMTVERPRALRLRAARNRAANRQAPGRRQGL